MTTEPIPKAQREQRPIQKQSLAVMATSSCWVFVYLRGIAEKLAYIPCIAPSTFFVVGCFVG